MYRPRAAQDRKTKDGQKMRKDTIYRVFSKIPELNTEHLILRRMLVSDKEDVFKYASRKDVTEYLTWEPHPDPEFTKEYLEYLDSRYRAGLFYDWGVVERREGHMIGTCGFTSFNYRSNSGEIGYVLHPDYWGHGLAVEACRRVMHFGFERLGLHRIEAHFMYGNSQSLRVLEKLGMTFEGYHREAMLVKGIYRTIGVCSILQQEFASASQKQ